MSHGNVANYQHEQSESLWIKRMTAEEAYVSVMTELVAYFELSELRVPMRRDMGRSIPRR
jgi:hypothetical protein